MALTTTEEALIRQLLDQQAALLSLAGNESTITSKLGATKVTLSDLVSASAAADADLLLMRQGVNDKSITPLALGAYMRDGLATQNGIQSQTYTAFTTGGTGTAFTLTPTPTLTANAAKVRYNVTLSADPSGSPTLAVSGQPALNFKYYDTNGVKQFVTTAQAKSGMVADIINDGTDWVLLNKLSVDNSGFANSLSLNGYQKLPSGMIIQWGTAIITTANTIETFSYPIAFPSMSLRIFTSQDQVDAGAKVVGASPFSPTQFKAQSTQTNDGFFFLAIGI